MVFYKVFHKLFLCSFCMISNLYSSTIKHARKAAMEWIVLSIALQTVRMTCVTMWTEPVLVNQGGKGLTAAKVNVHLGYLIPYV